MQLKVIMQLLQNSTTALGYSQLYWIIVVVFCLFVLNQGYVYVRQIIFMKYTVQNKVHL